MAQAELETYTLSPNGTVGIAEVVATIDAKHGPSDGHILGIVGDPSVNTEIRIEAFDKLYATLFSSPKLDQNRVGNLLTTTVALHNDPTTTEFIKETLSIKYFPQSVLERIAEESATHRWEEKAAEAALHAYCRFGTLEGLFGKEYMKDMHRYLARELIYARALDSTLTQVAATIAKEDRGAVIHLSSLGAEVMQVMAREAFTATCDEMDARAVLAPYYRDHVLSLNSVENPDGPFMTFAETIAEIARVEGSPRGAGLQLPVKGKIDSNGAISIMAGTGNVGGLVLKASGLANQLRLAEIQKRGVMFEKPKRADSYRDLQLPNTNGAVLISIGDGALPFLEGAMELQASFRVPAVVLIQNNNIAIGVESREVVANNSLWEKGHGRGIPGIRIDRTDAKGMFLAMRFATLRALKDAGPTIIEAMTERLAPHSSHHGDSKTASYVEKVYNLLSEAVKTPSLDDAVRTYLEMFRTERLIRPSQNDNQLALSKRLKEFLAEGTVPSPLKQQIEAIIADIIDPLETTLTSWIEHGFINKEEIDEFQVNAGNKLNAIMQEVLSHARPNPADALSHIRMPTLILPREKRIIEKVSLTGAEAISRAIRDAMRVNPRVLVWGTDVVKGKEIHGKGEFVVGGGYFGQERGLFELFGHQPARIMNTPIAENQVVQASLGMTTVPTTEKGLNEAFRVLYDPQYADYGMEAIAALLVSASEYYATAGQMTTPFGMLMLEGAVGGGGTTHSHSVEGKMNQVPAGVDIICVSDPQTAYEALLTCLLTENNPYIFIVDRSILFRRQTFGLGEKPFTIGRARELQHEPGVPDGIQFITYGPATNTTMAAVAAYEKDHPDQRIGILDLTTIRPFPVDDVARFLWQGYGPIVVVGQEPKLQGFGAQIVAQFADQNSHLRRIIGSRPIYWEGAHNVPAIPNDGILMNAVIPTPSSIINVLERLEAA